MLNLNVHTAVNACDCTKGFSDIARESALKVESGRKKSLGAPGNRTCVSSFTFRLYQLIYIPTAMFVPVIPHGKGQNTGQWEYSVNISQR